MYEKLLIKAGLSEKQAKVYLACAALGLAKAPEIARRASLRRSTVYGILDELMQKGLASTIMRGRLKWFRVQNVGALVSSLEAVKQELEAALPAIEQVRISHHQQPRVQFFEGKEGIRRIMEDTLRCRAKKILQMAKVREWNKLLGGEYTAAYVRKRSAAGITAYALHPASGDVYDEPYARESEHWKRHVRYLPPGVFYTSMIMVYDQKVATISSKEEDFGFIIESREFANTLRAYFDFMWNLGSKEPVPVVE